MSATISSHRKGPVYYIISADTGLRLAYAKRQAADSRWYIVPLSYRLKGFKTVTYDSLAGAMDAVRNHLQEHEA